ncbi:hypothetical protein F5X99DRAFT_426600 [Biscogniauxia marginata]|nr:hypothetical protein F5X99DRAFT_426600 [Biscogniauxia marginata]
MAVIDGLPGLQATIEVDGQDLQEYDAPHLEKDDNQVQSNAATSNGNDSVSTSTKHTHIVKKYIEAIPGTNFQVNFVKYPLFKPNCHHIAVQFEADNFLGWINHEPHSILNLQWELSFAAICTQDPRTGRNLQQKLAFGGINIDSTGGYTAESIKQNMTSAKGLGTLRVYVYEMQFTQKIRQDNISTSIFATEEPTIPEQAIKGRNMTHVVQFGKPEEYGSLTKNPEDVFLDPEKRPFAIFEFIYLSKEGLIKEGVLPEPLPIDNMDPDELRRWAREQFLKDRDRSVKEEINSRAIKKEEDQEPSGNRKRGPASAEAPAAKRYKENQREDGRVEIDLVD